jgi:hypothetical protein
MAKRRAMIVYTRRRDEVVRRPIEAQYRSEVEPEVFAGNSRLLDLPQRRARDGVKRQAADRRRRRRPQPQRGAHAALSDSRSRRP